MTGKGLLKVISLKGEKGLIFGSIELRRSMLNERYFFTEQFEVPTGQVNATLSGITGVTDVMFPGRIFTKYEVITCLHKNKLLK